MKTKTIVGICVAVALLLVLGAGAMATQWETANDEPVDIPFAPDADGSLSDNSLNISLFETYGPVLLVLSLLMFGAIVGGVCIAREEDEPDDSN